jgi:hypothetical protein
MSNHFQVLLYLHIREHRFNKIVGDRKKFMAYDIVNSLKKSGNDTLLKTLADGVEPKEKVRNIRYLKFRLMQENALMNMIEQKLLYMRDVDEGDSLCKKIEGFKRVDY